MADASHVLAEGTGLAASEQLLLGGDLVDAVQQAVFVGDGTGPGAADAQGVLGAVGEAVHQVVQGAQGGQDGEL